MSIRSDSRSFHFLRDSSVGVGEGKFCATFLLLKLKEKYRSLTGAASGSSGTSSKMANSISWKKNILYEHVVPREAAVARLPPAPTAQFDELVPAAAEQIVASAAASASAGATTSAPSSSRVMRIVSACLTPICNMSSAA